LCPIVIVFHHIYRLIIVDEADHLNLGALQSIRNLNDEAGSGVVLAGNDKIYRQMYSRQRGYEFDQIRSRIAMRKKVYNDYTADEIRDIFPTLHTECLSILLNLACKDSLRMAVKIHTISARLAQAQGKKVTAGILKDIKRDYIGD